MIRGQGSKRLQFLRHTSYARLSSSPLNCIFRCTSNQMTPHTHSPLPSFFRNLYRLCKLNYISFTYSINFLIFEYSIESVDVPGWVAQHMERSSMCSTSSPMNQEPSDTSSLAYLCNMGLPQPKPKTDAHLIEPSGAGNYNE